MHGAPGAGPPLLRLCPVLSRWPAHAPWTASARGRHTQHGQTFPCSSDAPPQPPVFTVMCASFPRKGLRPPAPCLPPVQRGAPRREPRSCAATPGARHGEGGGVTLRTPAPLASAASSAQPSARQTAVGSALGFLHTDTRASELQKASVLGGSRGRRGMRKQSGDQQGPERGPRGARPLRERLPDLCQPPAPPTQGLGRGRAARVAGVQTPSRQAPGPPVVARYVRDRTSLNFGCVGSVSHGRSLESPPLGPLTWCPRSATDPCPRSYRTSWAGSWASGMRLTGLGGPPCPPCSPCHPSLW